MSLTALTRFLTPFVVSVAMMGWTGAAEAGWLTIKNNTRQPIVVQEITAVNGKIKRGKPISLLPGETVREFIPGPTTKSIDIFDPQKPGQTLWTGKLNCPEETQTYSVSGMDGRVAVRPQHPPSTHK